MTLTAPRPSMKSPGWMRPAPAMPKESWLLRIPSRGDELLQRGRRGMRLDELKGWLCPSIGASLAFRRLFRDEALTATMWTEPGAWRIRVEGQAELRITRQGERIVLAGYHLARRERVQGTLIPGRSEALMRARYATLQSLQCNTEMSPDDEDVVFVERLVRDVRAKGELHEVWEKEGSDAHRCLTYRRITTGGWDNHSMERVETQIRVPDGTWQTHREHTEERRGNRAVVTVREWDERRHRYVTRCTERLMHVDGQGRPVVQVIELEGKRA